jgi:ribosomal protein L3 glutamine methyltransferase
LKPKGGRWTVGALLRFSARRLASARLVYGHGTANAREEAAFLVLRALGLSWEAGARERDREIPERAAQRALRLVERRIRTRMPAAYLLREAWLADHRFYVDRRAIVPRSHIAGLLRERLAPWIAEPRAVRRALDLGTGSGCLAVLLARAFPRARIDAVDVSAAALSVARVNLRRYRLGRRIRLLRSNLFSALRGRRYDLIVCNPPYVPEARMRRLPREHRHEPRRALAGGRDGLDLVRALLARAREHLEPEGLLVVEVGAARRRLERAFPRTPFVWPHTPGGETVFLVRREDLPRAPGSAAQARPSEARRAARARPPAPTRPTGGAEAEAGAAPRRSARESAGSR